MMKEKYFVWMTLILLSESAHAEPITDLLTKAVGYLTGNWAVSAALLFGAALGYRAWIGLLSWFWVGSYVVGLFLVFGVADLVSSWRPGGGGGGI